MATKLFGAIVILLLLGGGSFYLLTQKSPTTELENNQDTSPTPDTQDITNITPNPLQDALRAGGSSFMDPSGIFTALYPSDYILDTSDPKHPRIYKTGPTQTGQTEMYDGAIVIFEPVELGTMSLEKWVDDRIKSSTQDGTTSIIEPKETIQMNGYPGFRYTARGLGESQNMILQKDASSKNAIVITQLVADPGNVGFQQEVDAIISSIELLK